MAKKYWLYGLCLLIAIALTVYFIKKIEETQKLKYVIEKGSAVWDAIEWGCKTIVRIVSQYGKRIALVKFVEDAIIKMITFKSSDQNELPVVQQAQVPLKPVLSTGPAINVIRQQTVNHTVITIPSDEDVVSSAIEQPEWACDETNAPNYMIYCKSKLLHAVMMLNIFKDSKTFVDKPLKRDPEEVDADFHEKFPGEISALDREAVRNFIDENFLEEGHELEE